MTHRERFLATMQYSSPDRCPLLDFNFWDETLPAWHEQGLDSKWKRSNAHRYFGLDESIGGGDREITLGLPVYVGLAPGFERKVIKDLGDEEIIRDTDGVFLQVHKHHVSIPPHVGHTLVDRDSWQKQYLPRLKPDDPARFAENWSQTVDQVNQGADGKIITMVGGSLFGWLRDWMGMEHIALVPYDDPAWFEEMVTALADVAVACLEKVHAAGVQFQWMTMWEDMCYNAGPLLSPAFFKKYLVPQYKRITELARACGCQVVSLDCDGKIDDLLPMWLEAGVNCMFPVEIGDWADPLRFREQYGRDLLMMGGFDKHILAKSPTEIDVEIERLTPLVEAGGYIPFCDHRVPPDVPLANYEHYTAMAREIWGKGIDLPVREVDAVPG